MKTDMHESAMESHETMDIIPQDEVRGPGWFLKLSYIIITAFCIYYLVTQWNWKSDYDKQQEQLTSAVQTTQ